MKKRQWVFALCASLLSLCCAFQPQQFPAGEKLGTMSHEKGNPLWKDLKFKVDERVPKEYAIRNAPTGISATAELVKDLPPEILKREQEFSQYWMGIIALSWPLTEAQLARNIQGSDDGAYLDVTVTDAGPSPQIIHAGTIHPVVKWHYLVIDGRQLTVQIHKSGLGKNDMVSIFKQYIRCSPLDTRFPNQVSVSEMKDLGEGKSYGKITVDAMKARRWFISPIEWYRDGDTVLFLFIKEVTEGYFKAPPSADEMMGNVPYPATIVGGLPYNDSRPFRRFKEANYLDIIKVQFKKYLEEHPRPDLGPGPHGRH